MKLNVSVFIYIINLNLFAFFLYIIQKTLKIYNNFFEIKINFILKFIL